jgi:hypothetical protein
MKPVDIEREIVERIRRTVEATAAECVRELNERGHRFVADADGLLEWVDEASGHLLTVDCVLGVTVAVGAEPLPPPDPEVETYLEIAETGTDPMATVLAELEGDVANGGFLQLLDNKGLAFFPQAIECLRAIGASETETVVGDALELLDQGAPVLSAYDDLVARAGSLDTRFVELRESVARLYLQHRGIGGS